jgi:hypothetical protein
MEVQLSPLDATSTSWNVVTKTHDYALASWNEIVAVVWRHETTLEGVKGLESIVATIAQSHPKGIGMLTIVSAVAPMPSSAARKAIADLLSASPFVRCSAVIMEGMGFRAAAVRSVVTGLTMLSKHEFPHRICDVEDAVKMYIGILPGIKGRALSPMTVRAAIDDLRQQMLP